jgi:uncharacterized lipoprotein YajG
MVRGELLRAIAALSVALLLGACALAPETIDINYASRSTASPAQQGVGNLVELRTIDGRVSHRDRVGTKKNGYGVELARITASRSPLEVVRNSVQQELTARGFAIGPGGAILTIELLDFYSDFKPAFIIPVADSAAEVSFSLQIGAPGTSVFSRIYRGKGTGTDAIVMTPGAARVALEQALAEAMQQVTDDAALRTALASAASGVASSPSAPRPIPARAPAATAPTPAASDAPVPPPPMDYGQGLSRSRL